MSLNKQYNLVIAGGGTAGSICAIAAARDGLSVAILEENNYLGGIACGSGLAEMNAAGFKGSPLYRGIVGELFDELIANGDAEYHFQIPMSSNQDVKIDRLRFNPEMLKIVLEKKAVDAGIDIYYGALVTGAGEGEPCSVTAQTSGSCITLESDYLVDATGDCRLVSMLGYETIKPEPENLAVSTLAFRLSNIDIEALQEAINEGALAPVIADGYSSDILKGKILAFSPIPGTKDVSVNATRAKFDHEDILARTAGIVEARNQITGMLDFIRERVPGAKDAYISNIAPIMGVRDCRKLSGVYQVTLDDLETMRDFEDTIAVGCYPVDVHDPVTNTVIWHMLPGVYHIPYRASLPKGSRRILVAGKCISAQEKAFAAIRVMPIVMNIGESIGYAMSLACRQKKTVTELDGKMLHSYLLDKGILL